MWVRGGQDHFTPSDLFSCLLAAGQSVFFRGSMAFCEITYFYSIFLSRRLSSSGQQNLMTNFDQMNVRRFHIFVQQWKLQTFKGVTSFHRSFFCLPSLRPSIQCLNALQKFCRITDGVTQRFANDPLHVWWQYVSFEIINFPSLDITSFQNFSFSWNSVPFKRRLPLDSFSNLCPLNHIQTG